MATIDPEAEIYISATETIAYELWVSAKEAAEMLGVPLKQLAKVIEEGGVIDGTSEAINRFKGSADVINEDFYFDEIVA